ncbi:MAG: TRAP transporter substrate-binding protein [Rhodospirillaceae bacterium]|nr:TRAP transporter substrate-binding protein [Rhodospirillaceae bacterium]
MTLSRRVVLSAGASALAGSSVLAAPGQTRLRFGAYLAPASNTIKSIVGPWIKEVEAAAAGQLGFDLYTGGSLGRSPYAAFDLLRAGVSDIAFAQPNYTPGQFKQLQVLEVPFLTRSSVEASVVAWTLYERGLVKGFDDVHVLGLWTAEPGYLFMRLPVRNFDDLKNLKIRTGGRLEGEFIERLGATPEAMFTAEVYEALRRHTIDGAVQGIVSAHTFQSYRAVSHVLKAPFGVMSFALLMNKRAWERLPPELQEILTGKGGLHLALSGGTAYDKYAREIDAKFHAIGTMTYVEPSPEDIEQLEVAVKPLVDAWIERTENGAETYAAAKDILAQLRSRERAS